MINIPLCSNNTLYQQINLHYPSSIKNQQKISQIYQLPNYQINKIGSNISQINNICTFANINQNNKLQINQQVFNILQIYAKYQIIFCGVYGHHKSGKSTFIDEILQIDKNYQKGFISSTKNDNKICLKINKYPLEICQNKKLFFIEYSKGFIEQQLDQGCQKLLDLLIFISNSFVLINSKENMIKNIKKHIEISSKRLQYNLTNIHYWPQNLYIINTYNGLSKSTGDIDYLFRRLSLIIWNKGDKSLRHFIRDISLTGDIKSFRNIKNNYHIFHKLIVRLQQQQNLTKIDKKLNIEGIFQSIYQQLCNQYLKYHCDLYDCSLQQYFLHQKPNSIDYLISSFQKCKNTIMALFKQNHINKEAIQRESEKLQEYIDQRQRLIVEVNKKKSEYELKRQIEGITIIKNKLSSQDQISSTIDMLRGLNQKYEHAGVDYYAILLYDMMRNIRKGEKKSKKRQQQNIELKTKQLQNKMKICRQQLIKLRQKNRIKMKQRQQIINIDNRLRQRIISIGRQIQLQKKTYRQIFNNRLTSQQKMDKMMQIIRQYEQRMRQNIKLKNDIQKQYDFNPQIQRLNRKIQRLERKMNGQCSKLQSVLYSQIDVNIKTQSKITLQNKQKQNNKK